MRWLRNFRWPVKLALLVIALLAVIALGSGWWLPWDPAAINLQQRLLPPTARPISSTSSRQAITAPSETRVAASRREKISRPR